MNLQPLMSRDKYGFGMDLYELPTLIIYPFDDEEETTSGKANGVQITFDLGILYLYSMSRSLGETNPIFP